ncbi:MAG: hypothetical protein HC778_09115, partial [Chamaesiphon sp. CSU_1_12]|nr:hypothetical protein [Chamaesiphon sp. CSU_1_12]
VVEICGSRSDWQAIVQMAIATTSAKNFNEFCFILPSIYTLNVALLAIFASANEGWLATANRSIGHLVDLRKRSNSQCINY